MPQGQCRLCQSTADLQLSHVIPAFVYRWLRDSGSGHLRAAAQPNKRVQDGLKRHWLCSACEQRFNKAETAFAGQIFHPYLRCSTATLTYSEWLLYFCTSVSWRVLHFHMEEALLKDYSTAALEWIDKAEKTWADYLLGRRAHPGDFRQHLLPLDLVTQAGIALAPGINRYLTRTVDVDMVRGARAIFTYAKLGRFVILGFVHEPEPTRWKGTKVNANAGRIEPQAYTVPKAMIDYLNGKAHSFGEALGGISPRQQSKIGDSVLANIDKYVASDEARAMRADIAMFGADAFLTRKPSSTEDTGE